MRRRTFMIGCLAAAASGPAAAGESPTQAVIPRSEYYTDATRDRWGAWGPPARQFSVPAGFSDDQGYCQRRVVEAALRYVGIGYQHHHVPDFAPPDDWPWLRVSAGRNGPGLDCSNFTSLAFNEGLGLKLPTAIGTQSQRTLVAGPGGRGTATLRRMEPGSYDDAVATLRLADLLYIRSDAGRLSHVVLWVGIVNGTPSFVDCTDAVRRGTDGVPIPTGVAVRPFLRDNWYGRKFAHLHRLDGFGAGAAPRVDDGGDI